MAGGAANCGRKVTESVGSDPTFGERAIALQPARTALGDAGRDYFDVSGERWCGPLSARELRTWERTSVTPEEVPW